MAIETGYEHLLQKYKKPEKKKRSGTTSDDLFVFRNKHWYPEKRTNNFRRINIYFPTEVPPVGKNEMVFLHNHEPYEPCFKKYFCHEVGFASSDPQFTISWAYLYDNREDFLKF